MVTEGNFISPSLFSNYNALNGFSAKGVLKINELYSLGLGYNHTWASAWELSGYTDYSNSSFIQNSLSPTIQFHSKFSKNGIFNNLKLFAEIAPVFGVSRLSLQNSIFEINSGSDSISVPLVSDFISIGLKAGAGLEISFNQVFGVFISYTYLATLSESAFFNEKHYSCSFFELGFLIRLKKDKLFFE